MEEREIAPKIDEGNEITITVVFDENNFPKEKIIDNYAKDISTGGAKIQTHILLSVYNLIELESEGIQQLINAIGKVNRIKVIIEDESYEASVEFCGFTSEAIKKLEDYISWKQKTNPELFKKELSPTDSDNLSGAET
ncbi:MAG: PilZ domain-containing protein [Syntrophaceae bacterium]|nr:PilZ domain-containing protein [Syntrophaceae bacterium]